MPRYLATLTITRFSEYEYVFDADDEDEAHDIASELTPEDDGVVETFDNETVDWEYEVKEVA